MYRVRLIFAETSEALPNRKDVPVGDLDRAKDRARHELDLERYLAAHRDLPEPAPVTVQICLQRRLIWQLTAAERARERGL